MEFTGNLERSRARNDPALCGAIFMCNLSTKKECFERQLFGLPPSQANFVKKIKTGMVLFLFEHEERKLYGVFSASSDGAMNIAPKAFRSSGKQFPAQVRIKQIWKCHPVPEREFRDAFKDNYYSQNKFGFGLSKDQVHKLLHLFKSRKKVISPRTNNVTTCTKTGTSSLGTVRVTDKGRFVTTGRAQTELGTGNDSVPMDLARHPLSPRPNQLSILGNSEAIRLERVDPLVEGPHRSSRLHTVEPRLSDLLCSTSRVDIDNHVIAPYGTYRDSSFLSKRYCSPDVIDDLQDYIPLDPDPPVYEYLGNKIVDSNAFEGYNNHMPFPGSSTATLPVSREGADIWSSSFGFAPVNVLSPLPDADYVSGGPRYWHHASTATIPLSSEGKSHSQLEGYPRESRHVELYEQQGCDYSTDRNEEYRSPMSLLSDAQKMRTRCDYSTDRDEEYRSRISLHSDAQKTRTSVFSRLTKVKGTPVHDPNYMGNKDVDMSVEQIMTLVQQTLNRSREGMKNKKRSVVAHSDDHDDFDRFSELDMSKDVIPVNEVKNYSEVEGGEAPLVNFKRRSELQKRLCGTEKEGCPKRVDCEGLPDTSGKRRKLVRPSFDFKELKYDMGTTCEGKEDEGNQNESSRNVGLQNIRDNDGAEKGSTHGFPESEVKRNTAFFSLVSNAGEGYKEEGKSQELCSRDYSLKVKGLSQAATVSTGALKQREQNWSTEPLEELGDCSFNIEGKGEKIELSLKSDTGEAFMGRGQSLGHVARDGLLELAELSSQDAAVSTEGLKQLGKRDSPKAFQELGDCSFNIEGKGEKIELSLESDTGEAFMERGQSLGHVARDSLLELAELSSQDAAVSTEGLKQLGKRDSPKAFQEHAFESEAKGKKLKLSLESKTGEPFNEKEKPEGLGARDCSLHGLSQDAPVCSEAEKVKAKVCQELTDGSLTCHGKRITKESLEESNSSQSDLSFGKTNCLSVNKAEITAMLVDGVFNRQGEAEKSLQPHQCETEGKAEEPLQPHQCEIEGKAEESNSSQSDLSFGKTNFLSVSKAEITAMLVDGVFNRQGEAEKSLQPHQCETEGKAEEPLQPHQCEIEGKAEESLPPFQCEPPRDSSEDQEDR